MSNGPAFLLIGELSRRTGWLLRSLRYYERVGLLTPDGRASLVPVQVFQHDTRSIWPHLQPALGTRTSAKGSCGYPWTLPFPRPLRGITGKHHFRLGKRVNHRCLLEAPGLVASAMTSLKAAQNS